MAFFNKIFGSQAPAEAQPDLKFGRYTDSYKQAGQYDAWDKSLEQFEQEQYLDSYKSFFSYLRDERAENVKFWEADGGIRFEILQGSKKVIGFADKKKLTAEAKVAKAQSMHIGFLRQMVEHNFDLKFGRYALDAEDDIIILFDTYTLDGSPYKLYYALKEIATNADKQDDLLLDEFKMLEPVDMAILTKLSDNIKKVKYNFVQQKIQRIFEEMDNGNLNLEQYPSAFAYLLLNLCYKLDYLIKPEGFMMEALERIHRLYSAKDDNNTTRKNTLLRKEFQILLDRTEEDFFKEMYEVVATFGITSPVNHDKVVSFIEGELNNMDWFHENGHEKVALAVPGYIAGYCLFNFAIPKPDRDFFHLYFQIVEADYFKALGFTINYFNPATKTFEPKNIKKAIKNIVEDNKDLYPDLRPKLGMLSFDSLCDFAKSYFLMLKELDMTKLE